MGIYIYILSSEIGFFKASFHNYKQKSRITCPPKSFQILWHYEHIFYICSP